MLAVVVAAVGYQDAALLGGIAMAGLSMVPDLIISVPFVPHRGPTHTVHYAGLAAIGVRPSKFYLFKPHPR